MKTQRAYKFRFYPTQEQVEQLAKEFGAARWVWNRALREKEYAYQQWNVNLTAQYDICRHITQYKKTEQYQWLNEVTATCLSQKLIDLDRAFDNFFKGRAKFPKSKKKEHGQSIRYQLDQRNIAKNYRPSELLRLPKLGELNIKWSRRPAGIPKMATVSKTASGKYFVSFACEVEMQALPKTGLTVGIDIGIKDVIVTSDGFKSGAPKFTYQYQRKLKHEQKNLSRKTKGSNRYNKQRLVVAKIHEKITNSRRHFLHELTTKLVREYDMIKIEDLNVRGMMANKKLSKAVADVGIFELTRQLEYKAAWYGKEVKKISRWFPSSKTCSCCGNIQVMKLSDRVYNCQQCGISIDRDLNAAINIKTAESVERRCPKQLIGEAKASQNKGQLKRERKNHAATCMEQVAA